MDSTTVLERWWWILLTISTRAPLVSAIQWERSLVWRIHHKTDSSNFQYSIQCACLLRLQENSNALSSAKVKSFWEWSHGCFQMSTSSGRIIWNCICSFSGRTGTIQGLGWGDAGMGSFRFLVMTLRDWLMLGLTAYLRFQKNRYERN